MALEKLQRLRERLDSYGSCLVAYSGGVDSVFLAHVAHEVLQDRTLAVIADSPSLPRRELAEALALANQFGFPARVVQTDEMARTDYTANPLNRCYFCKHELFTVLDPIARELGFAVIAYGENASDLGDFRPGARAASEFQVHAPLKEIGLTKSEIRSLSAHLGLPTADKPQMACLSSRIPHGEPVTAEKLRQIEAAEQVLREMGFYDVRVRHHELSSSAPKAPPPATPGTIAAAPARPQTDISRPALARIEVGPDEISRFFTGDIASRVAQALRTIGYLHVTLDLQGYRRGNGNEAVIAPIHFRPSSAPQS